MKRHPASQLDANRGDLVLAAGQARGSSLDPNAHTPGANGAGDIEVLERVDQPGFKRGYKSAYVLTPLGEIKHHIDDALTRTVISILTASVGFEDRKAVRRQKVARLCRDPCSVKRRMLKQPNELAGRSRGDCGRTGLHRSDSFGIGHMRAGNRPACGFIVAASENRRFRHWI